MRSREEVISLNYSVDKENGKVAVLAKLSPRVGREPTVYVKANHVREYLTEQGVDAGVLISGLAIHNSMDRRLGLRTPEDLETTFVFQLAEAAEAPVEEACELPAPEVVEVDAKTEEPPKPKPRRTRKARTKKSVDK